VGGVGFLRDEAERLKRLLVIEFVVSVFNEVKILTILVDVWWS
jgi:hypothetical protein